MRLEAAGKSDIGLKRQINEDAVCVFYNNEAGLFAVADGMGGHANGEKASQRVIEELGRWWDSFSPESYGFEFQMMPAAIEQAIGYAGRCIYTEYNQKETCGTTVTVLFIYRDFYAVIYAGDSRCYLGHGRKWKQVTVDEVWENQSSLGSKERRMKNHPNRGKLVNAVGIRENSYCRVVTDTIRPDTIFLVCSDGLYKFCTDRFMKSCTRKVKDRQSAEWAADELIRAVYSNGAGDNVSVVVVKCL